MYARSLWFAVSHAPFFCRLALVLLALFGIQQTAPVALAQDNQPPDRRRVLRSPGLVLNTKAPVAACHAMQYTADGKFLVSAGEDKVCSNLARCRWEARSR